MNAKPPLIPKGTKGLPMWADLPVVSPLANAQETGPGPQRRDLAILGD